MDTSNSTTPLLRCNKCGNEYPATTEYFHARCDSRYGVRKLCRACSSRTGDGTFPSQKRKAIPAIMRADGSYAIQLTRGLEAIVDAEDADLAQFVWTASNGDRSKAYAYRSAGVGVRPAGIFLHRIIAERAIGRLLTKGEQVDHINSDKLDCRRSNLRAATLTQNNQNIPKHKDGNNPYKGAYYHKGERKWYASIHAHGKSHYLGRFDTPEEAHAAYCRAAKELHGEFARLE